MLESWIIDLRYAARRLLTRPTYALLAVLTLALGAGGSAASFGVVRTFLLDPLPYAHEEEVVAFWSPFDWSEQEFLYLRSQVPGFRQVAAYRTESATLEVGAGPLRLVDGASASAELFGVLGATPLLGRTFRPGDDLPGAEPVAVLSWGLWRELGGDPSVLGRRVRIGGGERTVVGVMPEGFWFPTPTTRVWTPTQLDEPDQSGNYVLVGRMAPGMTLPAMAAPLRRITAYLDERYDYPAQWDKTRNAALTPLREFLVGEVRPALVATFAAMGVILLIACANVAALMLGQVDAQSTDLAVRIALGATRRRLVQQLVAEALLVGMASGLAGAAVAASGFPVLVRALPLGALAEGAALDWAVFLAALGVAVLAAVVIALVPAVAVWRGEPRGTMSAARTGGVRGRGRMESGLVVTQVALAVLLAAGAGLLVRSVANLRAIDPGVDTGAVVVVDVAMPASTRLTERQRTTRELVDAVAALPGVRSAAATHKLPLRGSGSSNGFAVERKPELELSTVYFRIVTREYFSTMGIRVASGRGFDGSEPAFDGTQGDGAERAIVINQALARKYFPGEDPVGQRVGGFGGWDRIVGVVEDVSEAALTDAAAPTEYLLTSQAPFLPEDQSLVLRPERPRDAAAVLDAARRAIERGAGAAVQRTTTMDAVFAEAVGPARQVMALLSLLTALALVLGAIGIYGVISHFVARRRRDYGVRIALGLRPSRVVAQVVGRGGLLVAAGGAIGVAGALALARLLASFLYGVGSSDPVALAGAVTALLLVGVVAAWVPAWRASRTDPALVLREQ